MRASRSCSAYDARTLRLRLMRDQLAGKGSRSMIASAVEMRRIGLFLLARRRKTELRLPAISRDGSSPSKGNVFNRGNTRTSSDGSSAWTMPPSRSALFSSSARNTNPSRPDFFHCSRRWSANMPSGEDVEIAEPADFPFLVALLPSAPWALTCLLFFTRLPWSFKDVAAANSWQNTTYPIFMHPWITALHPIRPKSRIPFTDGPLAYFA